MPLHSATTVVPKYSRWRRPFEFWLDGIERGWAIPALLVGFVAIWMTFLAIAYQAGDLHPDVLETWSIGREFAWGNPKHPPLMGWMARGWSSVFPLTDWSFHLLAMVNSAIALWIVDLISRRFVSGDKRVIILLLLLLLPAYQFHAQRFNANTALLATWPLAIYCFLRSFETRKYSWAIAAGATAALAMLGKYYSIFLIAGFVLAAVAHPQRRAYFTSSAPWVSTLAGLVVLGPHIWWLATTGYSPFEYALMSHAGLSLEAAFNEAGTFVLGVGAYLLLPLFAWLLMIRSNLKTFASDLKRLDPGLILLIWIFVATVFFPPIVGLVMGSDLPPLWNLQALFLVVVVVVAAATFAVDRFDSVNLSASVLVFFLVLVAGAPFYALYRNTHAFDMNRNFLSAAAQEMTRRWHEASDEPFVAISGEDNLAFATAFYSPDHPVYRRPFQHQYTWGMPRRVTLDKGWAAMCFVENIACMNWMSAVSKIPASFVRSEFALQTSLWGRDGVTARISVLIVPPHKAVPAEPASFRDIEDFGASRRRMR